MTESSSTEKESWLVKIFKYGSFAWGLAGLSLGFLSFLMHPLGKTTPISVNELGDFFAGWFAPLAFAWFIRAVFMQQKELAETRLATEMQRKELAETREVTRMQAEQLSLQREELEGSRKALEEQSLTLSYQNFQGIFFQMLNIVQMRLRDISYNQLTGQKAIQEISQILNNTPQQDNILAMMKFEKDLYINGYGLPEYLRSIISILYVISIIEIQEIRDKLNTIFIGHIGTEEKRIFILYTYAQNDPSTIQMIKECKFITPFDLNYDGPTSKEFRNFQNSILHT